MQLVTRKGKGSALTNDELDGNFEFLNTGKGKALSFRTDKLLVTNGKIRPSAKPHTDITWSWYLTDTMQPLMPTPYRYPFITVDSSLDGRQIMLTYAYSYIPFDTVDDIVKAEFWYIALNKPVTSAVNSYDTPRITPNKRVLETFLFTDRIVFDINRKIKEVIAATEKIVKDSGKVTYSNIHNIDLYANNSKITRSDQATSSDYRNLAIKPMYTEEFTYTTKTLKNLHNDGSSLPESVTVMGDTITYNLVIGTGIITEFGFVNVIAASSLDYGLITNVSTKTLDYGTLI
jgi:hypothetical protein